MGRIEDLGLVADKGLEWKAKCEALTAERDQLRGQLETASGNARLYADKCTALEAEVERLRGASLKSRLLGVVDGFRAGASSDVKEAENLLAATTARAEAAEGRAASLYRGLCDAVRASGGVAKEGLSDTFLILGVPAEMAARKKAQEAAESTAAGLRRALEGWLKWADKETPVTHAERDAERTAWARIYQQIKTALTATSDAHERRIKSEALKQAAEEVYNRLNAKGAHSGARRQGWEAGLVDFADYLKAEADRLEAENG